MGVQTHRRISRWIPLLEVGVFFGLALFIIWESGRFRPPVLLVAVIMIGICIGSNYYHRDTIERIGLAKRHFWPQVKIVLPLVLILILPFIYLGWGKELKGGWTLWFSLLGYPFWGFAQEYALLGFVANRLEDVWPRRPLFISFLNGFLFSILHLPNPMLTSITFFSGVLFTFIFFKRRHLIPLALAHAAFGVALSLAFGEINGIMSVGPAYLKRIGNPF